MAKQYRNVTLGAKGVRGKDGALVMVEPGELTPEGFEFGEEPNADWFGGKSDQVEKAADAASEVEALRAENARLQQQLAALDGDGNGTAGGSKPNDPPALSSKSKAELLDIAKAEQVEASEDMTVAEIKDAIEAKRAA